MTDAATLVKLVEKVVRGDPDASDHLVAFSAMTGVPRELSQIANLIDILLLHRDVHDYRLEAVIQDLLNAQSKLEKANMDGLTGLPNRSLFHEYLQRSCEQTMMNNSVVALLFIDLDKFKAVNDTYGHDAGDELLKQASERMVACIGPDDVLARLGGDEFTVILNNLPNEDRATEVAKNIIEELRRPFQLAAAEVKIGCSIGGSFYPTEADTAIGLVKNADIAMYQAKASGKGLFTRYKSIRR